MYAQQLAVHLWLEISFTKPICCMKNRIIKSKTSCQITCISVMCVCVC